MPTIKTYSKQFITNKLAEITWLERAKKTGIPRHFL